MTVCFRCGRSLRNPASRKAGIGPRCARAIGRARSSEQRIDWLAGKVAQYPREPEMRWVVIR